MKLNNVRLLKPFSQRRLNFKTVHATFDTGTHF